MTDTAPEWNYLDEHRDMEAINALIVRLKLNRLTLAGSACLPRVLHELGEQTGRPADVLLQSLLDSEANDGGDTLRDIVGLCELARRAW